MHRFYWPTLPPTGEALTLTGREAHHGAHVLRLRRGEIVTVLDGTGGEGRCEVIEAARDRLQLRVTNRTTMPPLPYLLTLVQGIPKGKLLDSIIQKATELGVHRVVPLLSDRVVPQLDDAKATHKVEHWRTVAIEAIKQCGSPWLPAIDAPLTTEEFLQRREQFDLVLIGSLQPGARHPRDWFGEYFEKQGNLPKTVCLWIGPEGDFSPAELDQAIAAGARPISFGRLVLRCETAAVYGLSIVNYELQAAAAPT